MEDGAEDNAAIAAAAHHTAAQATAIGLQYPRVSELLSRVRMEELTLDYLECLVDTAAKIGGFPAKPWEGSEGEEDGRQHSLDRLRRCLLTMQDRGVTRRLKPSRPGSRRSVHAAVGRCCRRKFARRHCIGGGA